MDYESFWLPIEITIDDLIMYLTNVELVGIPVNNSDLTPDVIN